VDGKEGSNTQGAGSWYRYHQGPPEKGRKERKATEEVASGVARKGVKRKGRDKRHPRSTDEKEERPKGRKPGQSPKDTLNNSRYKRFQRNKRLKEAHERTPKDGKLLKSR
jgi:hypothetical protein